MFSSDKSCRHHTKTSNKLQINPKVGVRVKIICKEWAREKSIFRLQQKYVARYIQNIIFNKRH